MAAASEAMSFKKYGLPPKCTGCGRRLLLADARWWTSIPQHAVYGGCCFKKGAQP